MAISEDQGKPRRKWYRRQPNRFDRFALVFLVFLVCAGVYIVWAAGGNITTSKEGAYRIVKTDLQNAVNIYQNKNNGALPTINGTVTINGSDYEIINICSLLASQGSTLKYVRDSCISINGSDNDNCDAGCEGCYDEFSYIWAVDDEGNIYSTCVGKYCNASGVDGYQDVWP